MYRRSEGLYFIAKYPFLYRENEQDAVLLTMSLGRVIDLKLCINKEFWTEE